MSRPSIPVPFAALMIAAMLVFWPQTAEAHPISGKPTFPTLSETEEARVEQGKLVLRTVRDKQAEGAGVITGVIEIEATMAKIWSILEDFEAIPESSAAVKEAVRYVDEPGENGSRLVNIRYLVKVVWVKIIYHVHHDLFPSDRYLHWSLDPAKDNDIKATEGSFSLWPGSSPGRVRFLYITSVNTGRNIPDWVEDELTESSLKRYLLFVKKRAER